MTAIKPLIGRRFPLSYRVNRCDCIPSFRALLLEIPDTLLNHLNDADLMSSCTFLQTVAPIEYALSPKVIARHASL